MARQRQVFILSERATGSAENFLPIAAFSTNQKMNEWQQRTFAEGQIALEFRTDLLTLDPE